MKCSQETWELTNTEVKVKKIKTLNETMGGGGV